MDRWRTVTVAPDRLRVSDAVSVPLARALGWLYVAGSLVGSLWVWLPHAPDRGDRVVLAMAGLALVGGAVLVAVAAKVAGVVLHAALAGIQLVIAVAFLAEGDPSCDIRLFFLWATPYAALYWGPRAATAHLAWVGAVVATCLVLMPDRTHVEAGAAATMLLATLVATGVLAMTAAAALRASAAAQRHDATHDALTGLANRRRLLEVLELMTVSGLQPGGVGALVLLDLNGFKAVNDRYGHHAGDEVLREISAALSGVVRPLDLVCRLGGDEFALLVHDVVGSDQALALAQRAVQAAVRRSLAAPALTIGASAGVRLLDTPGITGSGALRDADQALYAAKRAGSSGPRLWTVGLRADDLYQQEMAADLKAQLRADPQPDGQGGQLRLVYQPVIDIETMRVTGLEALLRWRHPTRGDVPPAEFVPCAERAGLVCELTRWVLHSALSYASTWPTGIHRADLKLALNISALQLTDLQIVSDVRDALSRASVPANHVVLEVTETAAVSDLSCARQALTALAELGVGLALDDFGTGYSSLSYVQALPFDILKVDRSFVSAAAAGDRRAVATIAAVGALGAQLGVDVVAEGVEDPAELLALLTLGCRYAQGFGLSRPLEAAAVTEALSQHPAARWLLGTREARAGTPVAPRQLAPGTG